MITEHGATQWAAVMFGLASLPATFYLAVLTGEPGEGWDGSVLATIEPDDPGVYARIGLDVPADWVLTDDGAVVNAVEVSFADPSLDWGPIPFYALTDDLVAGQIWSYNWFLDPYYVQAGMGLTLPVGSIWHQLDNQLQTIAES